MVLRLLEKPRLLLENAQWLEVGGHVPRHLQVWSLGYQVSSHGARQLARAQDHHLTAGRVTADMADMHARQDLGLPIQVFDQLVSVVERREVIENVSGLTPHIRVDGVVPLAALDEVPGALESQFQPSMFVAPREAARVIP